MALSPAAARGRVTDTGDGADAPSGRLRLAVAALLGLVCVLAAGVLTWQLLSSEESGGRLDHAESRERVMSVTDQFVKRLGTYSPDLLDDSGQMPDYREQVRDVITPKFAADFDEQVAAAEQLVAQGGVSRTTEVFSTGVSSIDDDSARALIAGSFSDSYTQGSGEKARTVEQEPYPFRFVVDLVVIDGEWLVDDFQRAGGESGAEQPEPSPPGGTP